MTYEFACPEHGRFTVKQGINDEHHAKCPICGAKGRRIFEAAGHYHDWPKPLYHKDGSYREL